MHVSQMATNTVSTRELRTDFRAVMRRLEQHGEVVITTMANPLM
jgi:hypothetical protein